MTSVSTPALYNLSLYQGDSFTLTFRLRQQNVDQTPGDYLDLTGFIPKAQIRSIESDSAVLAEFTAVIENQTTTPGGVTLSLTHTQTAALAGNVGGTPYVWDVQLTSADATPTVTTYLKGNVQVTAEVTRP